MSKFRDRIFGPIRPAGTTKETTRVIMTMPEGEYPATVTVTRHRWRRPRWPWPRTSYTTEIAPDTPIPRPGPYDDDDATRSLLIGGSSVEDAVAELRDTVLKNRITG